MRKKIVVVSVFLALVLSGGWFVSRGRAGDAKPPEPRSERKSVELTVYAQDFGMVREVRPVQLTKGRNRLSVLKVSRQLDPQSVLLRW